MKQFTRVFTPTRNRRLNELIGFLLFVSAVLLFLALASYSPQDPSLNTAASPAHHSANNWIGIAGALVSDLLLQYGGIGIFFVPMIIGMLAVRWFRSRDVASPGAKSLGVFTLLTFFPALLALLPWRMHWKHAVPVEGVLGRVLGDTLLGPLSRHRILLRRPAYLGGNAFRFCLCSGAAVPGLASGPRQQEGRERTGEAAQRQTSDYEPGNSGKTRSGSPGQDRHRTHARGRTSGPAERNFQH